MSKSKTPDRSLVERKESIGQWVRRWLGWHDLQGQRLRRALATQTTELHHERQQRQQAEQDLAQQVQTRLLLEQVTSAIQTQMDSQQALEAIIAQVGQSFRVNRASIHIYVPPPIPEIPLLAEYVEAGYASMRQVNFGLEASLFLPELLASDGAVEAVDLDAELNSDLNQIKSLLAIRTSYRNQINGVITLQTCDHQRQWTTAEHAALASIAAQVGLALAQAKALAQEQKQLEALGYQNSVLRQEICERRQTEAEVKLLLNITQAITAAPDFNAALDAALSALCQTTGWIYGEVWLPAANGAVLESSPIWYCGAGSDPTIAALRQFRHRLGAVTLAPNEGIAGRVWSQQQPEWTVDDRAWPAPDQPLGGTSDEHLQYQFQLVGYGIRARLGVPILAEPILAEPILAEPILAESSSSQQTLAVLVFFTLEARPQDPRLIQLVSGVAMQLGTVLAQKQAEDALRQSAEREQALLRVIERMRQTLDIEQIFRTTVEELHHLLKCDRVLIYRFTPDWSGEFVAEAVSSLWTPVLASVTENATADERCTVRTWKNLSERVDQDNHSLEDTYLQDTQGGVYSRGIKYLCVPNVQQANLSDCYLELLNRLQAKAYLTVPIFQGQRLWGLLASYQNSAPRNWQRSEIHLVTHVSTQLGVALQQADLLAQTQRQSADLEKARDAAEAANRAKTQFLAHMSHELRTPLTSILGFTQIVGQEGALSPEHQDYLQIVSASGQHLLELINNVLELARLEADRASLQIVQFDLIALLENLEALFRFAAAQKQLTLKLVQTDLPRYVIADPGKLRQVLLNLLDNAIKFTQQGSVTLQVESRHSTAAGQIGLHFAVSDTGYGIAAEEMDSLFEAFVQSEAGRQSHQGSGLGLVISRRFVALMGGKLQVSSQLGTGSRFEFEVWVKLPQANSSAQHLGVHCIYAASEPQAAEPLSNELLPETAATALSAALSLMSADWLDQLYQAASGCSERQVMQLIANIPVAQAALAKPLAELASNFQFETIIELTQPCLPPKSQTR